MELEVPFEVLNWIAIFGIYYWALTLVLELMTYIQPRRSTAAVLSVVSAVIFIKVNFLASFLLLLTYLLWKKTGFKLALSVSVFVSVFFLIGAVSVTILFGIIGTALHVPGYEMHGTLRDLLEMAYR